MKEKTRYSNGFDLISEIFNLSILAIKHDCFIIPEDLAKNDKIKTKVFHENKAMKYLKKYDESIAINSHQSENYLDSVKKHQSNIDLYKKYLLSSGLSFHELFAKCFKLDKESFNVKITPNNDVKIEILSEFGDDFLIKNKVKIEKKLSKLNQDFEKKKITAIKKQNEILEKSMKNYEISFEKEIKIAKKLEKSIQKENFIL